MLLGYNEASNYIKMCLASTIEIIILMTNQGWSSRILTNLNLIKRFGILYGPMHLFTCTYIIFTLYLKAVSQPQKKNKNKKQTLFVSDEYQDQDVQEIDEISYVQDRDELKGKTLSVCTKTSVRTLKVQINARRTADEQ